MTEDEVIGWHHQLNGPEFEQAQVVGDGDCGSRSFWTLGLTLIRLT